MAQKIKLSTIADALKVSTATVSLALRDSPLVADQTREKIKEHARAIGYIYNRRAASLRTSRSGIVGVVVHDIMNPFFAEILRAIEGELDRSGQTFILSNHYDQLDKQRTFIDTVLQLGGDGVIMSPAIGTPAEDIRMAEDNGLPVVLIARSVKDANVRFFAVMMLMALALPQTILFRWAIHALPWWAARIRPRLAATVTKAIFMQCRRRALR